MHMIKVNGLLVLLCCELCLTIKVPVIWHGSGNSAVNNEPNSQVEIIKPQNVQTLHQSQPIPIEYFQYTAQKPQFAVDIATFHGVKNPQQHYKAYPIKPFTGKDKPILGNHQLLNEDQTIYKPYQNYVQKTEGIKNHVSPTSTGYEIFHPYKAEQPALQEIYKDPVMNKIRNDLQDSKNRLQAYEEEAGKPNIESDEYLESHQKTDAKLFPQKNIPAPYEIHRPERRPVYYKLPPRDSYRDHALNQRFRHPWNQHNIKIRPQHYKPLKNHIQHLRQHHAMKFDDERNEYPETVVAENNENPPEGYDIYEKGKQKYTELRNNVDESINKAVQQNRPAAYEKLELQKDEPEPKDEEEEFIPIKNYAQVRKTETFKHLPKAAAFDDAETYEEIINAPRLREAVKSTKAQTVYSEEGYEDSAYDHAGEQKHASDHEGHGGYLKQYENSGGLYKIPSVLGGFQDGKGSEYRDNTEHAKKWKTRNKDDEEETEAEDYSENEREESIDANIYSKNGQEEGNRNKREGTSSKKETKEYNVNSSDNDGDGNDTSGSSDNEEHASEHIDAILEIDKTDTQHDVDKREVNFKVPEINLNDTYLTEGEIIKLAKEKIIPKENNIQEKYPYYFKNLKAINKNSPLRYAENLKYIPNKSDGGTEFYDSRSKLECPEVDDDVDPLPEKLKNGENPTEDNDSEEDKESNTNGGVNNDPISKLPRLRGLGDKIDCFKAKYFGENPLDSPFFKEEIISNPEPIAAPKLPIFTQLKSKQKQNLAESNIIQKINTSNNPSKFDKTDIFVLLDKLRTQQNQLKESLNKTKDNLKSTLFTSQGTLPINNTDQTNLYSDILTNIKSDLHQSSHNLNIPKSLFNARDHTNKTFNFYNSKEDVTKLPPTVRRKRATPFVYEPYKIIRDNQFQDSKKTTTTNNISPLIRQLQSSRVADRVSRSNPEDRAPKSSSRMYVDIGKKDRTRPNTNPAIVDVSIDQRRGEPRYEVRSANHKSEYTPVENTKTMSVEDYKTRAATKNIEDSTIKNEVTSLKPNRGQQRSIPRQKTTVRPFYDVSSFLPKTTDIQNAAASVNVKKTITSTTPETVSREIDQIKEDSDDDSEESDEEYDEDEDEGETITTTTTTTPKPSFRRRARPTTTTEKSNERKNKDEPEKLRLITRFSDYKPIEKPIEIADVTEPPIVRKYREEEEATIPSYREKKKKSSKSTLVTDTKKYGDDDEDENDMRRKEVDALIGVKHDMDDYMPLYEKEEKKRQQYKSRENNEDDDDDDDDEDDDSEDEDEEDNDDDDDREIDEDVDDNDDDDDDNNNDESDSDSNKNNNNDEKVKSSEPEFTTPEPTKRTLIRTTDAPPPTVASLFQTTTSRNTKPESRPIVTRKKIEIHKELPVNKSSPHVTQFKQDIKEVEIIKEMPTTPKRKPHKKVEALELYKDDNLAKDINKLGDVEIFSENIDIDKGPKHGGNYKKATKEDLRLLQLKAQDTKPPKDAEASQSENTRHIEVDRYSSQRMHGGNLKSLSDIRRTRPTSRNAKIVELSDSPVRTMHGGNLRYDTRRRGGRRNEKLIELDDDHDDDHSSQDDDYKSSSPNTRTDRLHGGNYRSAKLIVNKDKDNNDIRVKNPAKEARRSATALLNSFVQAAPVLTTTPGYIVDPSKRMYYYVEI